MPEGVIDVIPVDLVVAAILAVARHRARPRRVPTRVPRGLGRAGTRSATASWSSWSSDWFSEHPLYDDRGQPIVVPEWSFPGRGRVQRQLSRATRAMDAAERLLTTLPVRGRQAELAARSKTATPWPSGPSATSSSTAPTPRPRPSTGSTGCSPCGTRWTTTTGQRSASTRRSSTGPTTSTTIHLPSVVEHARVRTTPGKSVGGQPTGPGPRRHPLPRPAPGRLRPREHPHRLQRRRLLRLAGQPSPARRPSG